MINELNQKHKAVKFNLKYSETKIDFLDVLVYKNKLQTTLYKNPTDRQSYLYANWEHLRPLKESMGYIQGYLSKEFASQIPNLKPISI